MSIFPYADPAWGAAQTINNTFRNTSPQDFLQDNTYQGTMSNYYPSLFSVPVEKKTINYSEPSSTARDIQLKFSSRKGIDVSSLPPGIQKKVANGGEIPPGLQKKSESDDDDEKKESFWQKIKNNFQNKEIDKKELDDIDDDDDDDD